MKDSMLEETEKKRIVPLVVGVLETKYGIGAATKGHHIISYLSACGHEVNPGRFRLIINFIRSNDLIVGLVAGGSGYYRTNDPQVIENWIKKEVGIIKQKAQPIKRMKLYLRTMANAPGLQLK